MFQILSRVIQILRIFDGYNIVSPRFFLLMVFLQLLFCNFFRLGGRNIILRGCFFCGLNLFHNLRFVHLFVFFHCFIFFFHIIHVLAEFQFAKRFFNQSYGLVRKVNKINYSRYEYSEKRSGFSYLQNQCIANKLSVFSTRQKEQTV